MRWICGAAVLVACSGSPSRQAQSPAPPDAVGARSDAGESLPDAPPAGEERPDVCSAVCEPGARTPAAESGRLSRPRSTQLVVVELVNVERLLAATEKNDIDRPRLVDRLAQGYVELATTYAADGRSDAERTARERAIAHLTTLLDEYPAHCTAPRAAAEKRGCADAQLLLRGEQLQALGEREQACQSYRTLLDRFESSELRGSACRHMQQLR